MKSKICLSLWSLLQKTLYEGKSLEEVLEIAATLGVDGVDLGEDYLRWSPYSSLHGLNRVRKKVQSLGLEVLSTWFYTDFVGAVRTSSVKTVVDQVSNMLAKANQLESPFIALPPGDAWAGVNPEEGHKVFLEVFEKLVPVAEEYNVRMGLEVGRPAGPFQSPEYSLKLVRAIQSNYVTIAPDFEAWRHATLDLPLVHVEAPGSVTPEPTSLEVFRECMPYSPLLHVKMLGIDENGEEPHIPIPEMMQIVNETSISQVLDIEYEGWIPDIRPDNDSAEASKKCVALLNKYLH